MEAHKQSDVRKAVMGRWMHKDWFRQHSIIIQYTAGKISNVLGRDEGHLLPGLQKKIKIIILKA